MFGRVPDGWQERFEVLRARVRATTPEVAVPFGRQYAVNLFYTKYRVRPTKAEAVYEALKELAPPASRPTINIRFSNLKRFIRENEYQTAWDHERQATSSSWIATFQSLYDLQRRQAETALGTYGLNPIYGALSSAAYGARDYGDAFIELNPEVIQDRALLLAGDAWRIVNTHNPAYVGTDGAVAIQYHPDWLPDARAAATMLWPPTYCLRQGDPTAIAACILEGAGTRNRAGKGERSYTEFHLFGGLSLNDVRAFHVTTSTKAVELLRLLQTVRVDIPVYVIGESHPYSPTVEGYPFKIGDRVVLNTGAVAQVIDVRRLSPEQVESRADGTRAYVALRSLKGPSPAIYGWALTDDTANVRDIDVVRVLRPREVHKLPPLTRLMERNRKLMRERGELRGKEFRARYLDRLPPFQTPDEFRVWFTDLVEAVPGVLGKWALQNLSDTEFVPFAPETFRDHPWTEGKVMQQWLASMNALGTIFGWYEMANELGVETEPPMAGAPRT